MGMGVKDGRQGREALAAKYGGGLVVRDNNKRLAVRGTASLCGPASSSAGRVQEGNNHNAAHRLTVMGMSIGIPMRMRYVARLWAAANEDQQALLEFMASEAPLPSAPVRRGTSSLGFPRPAGEGEWELSITTYVMRRGVVVGCRHIHTASQHFT